KPDARIAGLSGIQWACVAMLIYYASEIRRWSRSIAARIRGISVSPTDSPEFEIRARWRNLARSRKATIPPMVAGPDSPGRWLRDFLLCLRRRVERTRRRQRDHNSSECSG